MERIAQVNLNAAGQSVFLTLTYPRAWTPDPAKWKRDLDRFGVRLRRRYRSVFGPWRLEPQKRGAPHFHLILWRLDVAEWDVEFSEFQDWCLATWYRVVGSGDKRHLRRGAYVVPTDNRQHLFSYVSKYVAKLPGDDLGEGWEYPGRWWGWLNRKGTPIEAVTVELGNWEMAKVRRWMLRMLWGPGRGRHRALKQRRRAREANGWHQPRGPRERLGGARMFVGHEVAERLVRLAIAETGEIRGLRDGLNADSSGIRSRTHAETKRHATAELAAHFAELVGS